jgi:PAS domain S-box-containing protein
LIRFSERYVVTRVRVTVTQPTWVCGCGEETYVRTILKSGGRRTPEKRRLLTGVSLPLEGVVEMRHALVYIGDQAQPGSATAMRDMARHAMADLQHCPRISILAADDSGRFMAANDAVCHLTGYAEDELLAMSTWDLSPGRNVEKGQRLWRRFLRDGGFDGEYDLRRKTGEVIEIRCLATAHVLPGMHVATMASRRALCEIPWQTSVASHR